MERCASSEDVPVEWAFLLLATTVDAQLRALQAVVACLRARGVAPQNLPSEQGREAAARMSACAIRAMARVVSDIGEVQLAHAVVQPYAMPLELHGGPRRSRSPLRSERLRGDGASGSGARPGEDAAVGGVVGESEGARRTPAPAGGETGADRAGVRGRGRGRQRDPRRQEQRRPPPRARPVPPRGNRTHE